LISQILTLRHFQQDKGESWSHKLFMGLKLKG
jgi:hypothetical protein